MKAGFYTLGCKLNQSETEALAAAFINQGFSIAGPEEPADLYLVSTCTVTSKAEQKARRLYRRLARLFPGAPVLVTGCGVVSPGPARETGAPGLRFVPLPQKARLLGLPAFLAAGFGPEGDASRLAQAVDRFLGEAEDQPSPEGPQALPGAFDFFCPDPRFHHRAFLKIQEGCDNHCAFCRVRVVRGSAQSLPEDRIRERFELLEAAGFREIVLTGVNIGAWRQGDRDLSGLLEGLLSRPTAPRARIRLSSLEPESLTPPLIEVLGAPEICPHFHLPLQSGSPRLLSLMARRCGPGSPRDVLQALKGGRPGAFLAADIIAGFPGEEERDFSATLALAWELPLQALHVFPFSPRRDTPAWNRTPRVPEERTRRRTAELRALSRRLFQNYLEGEAGRLRNFLILGEEGKKEGERKEEGFHAVWEGEETDRKLPREGGGYYRGISENYLSLRVFFPGPPPRRGEIYPARIRKGEPL
jgi:threonylcarbamoyladenosine tRNA methylthiotransferase MtaB